MAKEIEDVTNLFNLRLTVQEDARGSDYDLVIHLGRNHQVA